MSPELAARLKIALRAAEQAGAVLMRHDGQLQGFDEKSPIDLVTDADRESEAVVLAELRAAFPADVVLAEERDGRAGAQALRAQVAAIPFAWAVDPLDGTTNFALPDLRGRTPLHRDNQNYVQGEIGGAESVTLTPQQLPMHNHMFVASTTPATSVNTGTTTNHLLATSNLYNAANPGPPSPGTLLYGAPGTLTPLSGETCGPTGGAQPHENMQPSLVLNYIIALTGIYPSRG